VIQFTERTCEEYRSKKKEPTDMGSERREMNPKPWFISGRKGNYALLERT
jgi:hypothetical protein